MSNQCNKKWVSVDNILATSEMKATAVLSCGIVYYALQGGSKSDFGQNVLVTQPDPEQNFVLASLDYSACTRLWIY